MPRSHSMANAQEEFGQQSIKKRNQETSSPGSNPPTPTTHNT